MSKTIIYFIRHAESPFIFGEELTRPLSKRGKSDALLVKNKLSDINFDQFISSSYQRAKETIEPLANGKYIKLFNELREKALKGQFAIEYDEIEQAIKNHFKIEIINLAVEKVQMKYKREVYLLY